MAKQIKTEVALEEYEFTDANGKVLFTLAFNPADLDIVNRYEDVVNYLNNTKVPADDAIEALREMSDTLAVKLNDLFNADIATPVYSVMNPFTPLASGKLYIEEIVDKIGSIIEQELKVRTKKVQSRMNKYTAKYHS